MTEELVLLSSLKKSQQRLSSIFRNRNPQGKLILFIFSPPFKLPHFPLVVYHLCPLLKSIPLTVLHDHSYRGPCCLQGFSLDFAYSPAWSPSPSSRAKWKCHHFRTISWVHFLSALEFQPLRCHFQQLEPTEFDEQWSCFYLLLSSKAFPWQSICEVSPEQGFHDQLR